MKIIVRAAAFLVIISALVGSIACKGGSFARATPSPAQLLSSYQFSPDSSIISRTGTVPAIFLEHMRRVDKQQHYRAYTPTSAERESLRRAIARLPRAFRVTLKRHVIGIYFIENFLSNGYQEWVQSRDGKLYSIMVLHPRQFRLSASSLLTMRERTNFKDDGSGVKIHYIVPKRWTALDYLLRHEIVHALDYARRITPFVSLSVRAAQEKMGPSRNFGVKYWKDWNRLRSKFDFEEREYVTFYGMRNGPWFNLESAQYLYLELAKSPFASLYGMQSRHEDVAELAALGSMCAADCRIEIESSPRMTTIHELFSNAVTRARADRALEIMDRLTR